MNPLIVVTHVSAVSAGWNPSQLVVSYPYAQRIPLFQVPVPPFLLRQIFSYYTFHGGKKEDDPTVALVLLREDAIFQAAVFFVAAL